MGSEYPSQAEYPRIPNAVRMRYWIDFARGEHRREMELLLHEAKLGKRPRKVGEKWEGWNNVIKHQVGEAAAMRALGQALKIPEDQVERQETFAFVHDAQKHVDKAPYRDFTAHERKALNRKLEMIFQAVDPDGTLRVATHEEFFYKVFERTPGDSIDEKIANTPQPELLQYYVDGIFVDGKIVSPLERISQTEKRRQDLNDAPERTRRLGMKYWDAERLVATKAQELIWRWLKENNVHLNSPDDVPGYIRQKIEQDMVAHWLEVHGKEDVIVDLEKGSGIEVEILCDTKRTNTSGVLAPERNEDTGVIQQRGNIVRIGIFDGATNIGVELPMSPGKAAAVTCREAVASAPIDATPREMLLRANSFLRGIAAGLPLSDEDRNEVLTAVGAVARLDTQGKKLDVASIADCHIVVLHADGERTWLTKNTSVHCERLEIAAAVWGAENPEKPLPGDRALLENLDRVMSLDPEQRPAIKPLDDPRVLEVISRNRRLENNLKDGGQPSLKGSDDALVQEGIQEASVTVEEGDEIFLFTDGGFPGPLYTVEQQQEVIGVLRQGGIQGLHAWVCKQEEADPFLRNPPRMKQFDDLVALCVQV